MKVNKILRYIEFITEEMNDTPETYIKGKLTQLKRAIDLLFEEGSKKEDEPETISKSQAKDNHKKKKEKLSMADMGVTLDSSEISVYSQTDDTLTVKYSDQEGTYNLLFSINIKDGISKDKNIDFNEDDITKLFIKFKKYGIDNIDLIGQTTYNVNVSRDGGDFMFSLNKKPQEQPQEQPQEEGEEVQQEEGEKMNLMEFLEFLKSDFDDKYSSGEKLDYETE